jgi:hypothetical protein
VLLVAPAKWKQNKQKHDKVLWQTYLQVWWVRDWTHLPASMFVIEPSDFFDRENVDKTSTNITQRATMCMARETYSHPRCVQSGTHLHASMFVIMADENADQVFRNCIDKKANTNTKYWSNEIHTEQRDFYHIKFTLINST